MKPTDTIFVTGGTGFIGTRLVEALVARGHRVRALSRRENPAPPPGWEGAGPGPLEHERVEIVRGDVTDRDSLARGIEGCSRVFHLAGYAKNWAPSRKVYRDVNVQGVKNVLDAAAAHGVQRIVCTSTLLTLGPTPPGVVGDEDMPRRSRGYFTEYEESKTLGERVMLRRAAEGLPVVVVNPTRVYGPGHLTEANALAQLIDDYDRGRVPVLLNRGVNVANYVYVDDVVQGHLLAMETGRVGQRYILGGDNVSLKEFFRTIDKVSGKRHFQIPMWWIAPMVFACLLKLRADALGIYPRITPGWMQTFLTEWVFSSDKARRELGYEPTPLAEGIRITYEWLLRIRERG
jgi:farnesol dehydrogenase